MPTVSSDTVFIETTLAAEKSTVVMTTSIHFGTAGELTAAIPKVVTGEFGNPGKHPRVSPSILGVDDTMLDWVNLSKKLERFRDLEKGWDGYHAAPPNAGPLGFASAFLDLLRRNRYLPSRLAPSVVGGVGMTFRKEGRKVYVEFSNKGAVHALFSDGVTEPVVQKIVPDLSGYRAIIAKMRAYLDEQASAVHEE